MENFNSVLKNHFIKIPIIQRDYAQGRRNKIANEIRENFLSSILEVLLEKKTLHLDFIYGSEKGADFFPLDGQQRLTTLFLLHWYFGKKQGKDINHLKRFTYETRASSGDFSNNLVDAEIDFLDGSIKDQILDSNWFVSLWENDPTIKSMLVMIASIHDKFSNYGFYDELDNINFHFFLLKDFGLDDDLFIKMNARGKPLTEFEIFKARFEQHLIELDEDLKDQFSNKIDNEWNDFFWSYAVRDESFVVDAYFMNFFYYITRMIHHSKNESLVENDDFELIKDVYSDPESVKFLFKTLDNLAIINDRLTTIFSKEEYEIGKVCLFSTPIDLVDKAVLAGFQNIQQRVLLFLIISDVNKAGDSQELVKLVRFARNLMIRNRHLKRGKINYTGDLIYGNVHHLFNLFLPLVGVDVYDKLNMDAELGKAGIRKESYEQEITKIENINNNSLLADEIYELEDFKFLRGDLSYFMSTNQNVLSKTNVLIRKYFEEDQVDVIRGMMSVDNYALYIGWTYLGDKYFLGKDNSWEILLTPKGGGDDEFDYSKFFSNVLESYDNSKQSVDKMVESYLESDPKKNWCYYFAKYKNMGATITELTRDESTVSLVGNYEIEKLGGSNLNAYHLNPYVYTISKRCDGFSVEEEQYDYCSCLKKGKIKIFSENRGWKLTGLDKKKYSKLIADFGVNFEGDTAWLKEADGQDRIEVMEAFSKML
jgi:uncharacterized protein with ParB-like and HNH nuclease domain